jgi:hypothetical protein
LNQLSVEGVRYPDSTDVVPLMEECVEFDPAVRKAMVSDDNLMDGCDVTWIC